MSFGVAFGLVAVGLLICLRNKRRATMNPLETAIQAVQTASAAFDSAIGNLQAVVSANTFSSADVSAVAALATGYQSATASVNAIVAGFAPRRTRRRQPEPDAGPDGMSGRRRDFRTPSRPITGRGEPALTDRPYEDDESEFLRAIEAYKSRTGRQWPDWTEALAILKSLGYRKQS